MSIVEELAERGQNEHINELLNSLHIAREEIRKLSIMLFRAEYDVLVEKQKTKQMELQFKQYVQINVALKQKSNEIKALEEEFVKE